MGNLIKTLLLLPMAYSGFGVANENMVDPSLTELWEPVPAVVTTSPVPSDAFVLFNGHNLTHWSGKKGKPEWTIDKEIVTVNPGTGGIATQQKFCDVQLHIEWQSPAKEPNKTGQQLGNSGIFLQGRYEVQVLNSFQNQTYVNGQAGSIYKQSAPLVNVTAPTGEWNTYDIIFNAPVFKGDKSLKTPGYITVLHNGVLVQNHFEIKGETRYQGLPEYQAHGCGPIYLQDHNDKVSYRNIWVREL